MEGFPVPASKNAQPKTDYKIKRTLLARARIYSAFKRFQYLNLAMARAFVASDTSPAYSP